MSDARGHDHLPDQAALDELTRAFAADETDHAALAADADPEAPPATEPSVIDGKPAHLDESDDFDEFVLTAGSDADDQDAHADLSDDADDLDHDHNDHDHNDLDHDDHDHDHDHDDHDLGEGADPLIVEQEPLAADDPAPPTIIRIDDLAGSHEIVAPDAASQPTTPAEGAADRARSDAGAPAVISIDDDGDLPDAVYVEGSLDRNGIATIVIIEDDDTGDALVPETERDVRRGIEPRLRERRVAVKRAQGRKRLKWVALVGAVVVVVVGTLAVLGSSLFAVRADRVTITGNVYADPAAVEAVIDDIVGTPALRVDTERAERDLEAIPWVDDARVRVDFPYAASIEIRERAAWTTYQGPDLRYRVLDRDGRVLDVLDGYPIAYVLITGPDPVDLDPGEFAPRGYAAASELAKRLTGSVRTQVVSIEVVADGSQLSLRLDDGTEVRFGEARDLFAKLVRLETVLSAGNERPPGIIDVSTREVTVPGDASGQDEG